MRSRSSPLGHPGPHRHGVGPELDRDVGVGHQVVVPVGVRRCAGLRAEDGEVVADRLVHERVDALGAGAGARGVEEQHRRPLELAADLATVGPELVDDRRVEVGHAAEGIGASDRSRRARHAIREEPGRRRRALRWAGWSSSWWSSSGRRGRRRRGRRRRGRGGGRGRRGRGRRGSWASWPAAVGGGTTAAVVGVVDGAVVARRGRRGAVVAAVVVVVAEQEEGAERQQGEDGDDQADDEGRPLPVAVLAARGQVGGRSSGRLARRPAELRTRWWRPPPASRRPTGRDELGRRLERVDGLAGLGARRAGYGERIAGHGPRGFGVPRRVAGRGRRGEGVGGGGGHRLRGVGVGRRARRGGVGVGGRRPRRGVRIGRVGPARRRPRGGRGRHRRRREPCAPGSHARQHARTRHRYGAARGSRGGRPTAPDRGPRAGPTWPRGGRIGGGGGRAVRRGGGRRRLFRRRRRRAAPAARPPTPRPPRRASGPGSAST